MQGHEISRVDVNGTRILNNQTHISGEFATIPYLLPHSTLLRVLYKLSVIHLFQYSFVWFILQTSVCKLLEITLEREASCKFWQQLLKTRHLAHNEFFANQKLSTGALEKEIEEHRFALFSLYAHT